MYPGLRWGLQVLVLCIVGMSLPGHAQVFKCEVDGKIEYSQLPCEEEESTVKTGFKRVDSELDQASIHGTISSVREIDGHWQCKTIAQAFEHLPSAFSAGKLLFDFSTRSQESLEEFSKVRLGNIQLKSTFDVKTATQHRPYCKAVGVRSLRKPKASITFSIRAIDGIPKKEVMPKASEILSLLRQNGYRMTQREDHWHTYNWEMWQSTCRSELTTRYNSSEELKGVKFSVTCSRKKEAKK